MKSLLLMWPQGKHLNSVNKKKCVWEDGSELGSTDEEDWQIEMILALNCNLFGQFSVFFFMFEYP